MRFRFLLIISFLVSLLACNNHSSTYPILVRVDSLIVADSIDEAWNEISKVEADNISDDDDMAYHHLLITYLQYRKGIPMSDMYIDNSIDYYKENGDDGKLALAYFNKSLNRSQVKERFFLLKKAEVAASESDDPYVLEKVNFALCSGNIEARNFQAVLTYAKKEIDLANKYNNKEWKAKALQKFLLVYYYTNNKDSVLHYSKQSIEAIKFLKRDELKQASLTNVGLILLNIDSEMAKDVLMQSLKIMPKSNTYYGLANYYNQKGNMQAFDSMITMAKKDADLLEMSSITELNSIVQYNNGNYKGAYDNLRDYMFLQDSVNKQVHYEQAFDVQASFDKDVQEQKMKNIFYVFMAMTALLVTIIVVSIIYLRYRNANIQKDLYQNMLLRSSLEQQLQKLEGEGKDADKEVDTLKKKITEIQSKQSEMLSNGNKLYSEIFEENGNTLKWDKKDFDDFIEFYRMKDIVFVNALETEYTSLSNKNKVFEIVRHVMNDDTVLERVFGISAVSVRSAKSRINAKRISQQKA